MRRVPRNRHARRGSLRCGQRSAAWGLQGPSAYPTVRKLSADLAAIADAVNASSLPEHIRITIRTLLGVRL